MGCITLPYYIGNTVIYYKRINSYYKNMRSQSLKAGFEIIVDDEEESDSKNDKKSKKSKDDRKTPLLKLSPGANKSVNSS